MLRPWPPPRRFVASKVLYNLRRSCSKCKQSSDGAWHREVLVLSALDLVPYKVVNSAPQPLLREGEGWACSEGDIVVLDMFTHDLPIVRMAGHELQPKRLVQINDRFEARYELFINTWAGRTTVELLDGTIRRAITLEIGPHERKLSPYQFDAMLAELSDRSPGFIWGLSPGTRSGVATSAALAVVHPVIIASQLPVFERLLLRFMADPPTTTRRTREARPLDISRRADLMTLRWLGRRPAVLRALRGKGDASAFDPRTPVDQPKSTSSYDHPVTRYLAYLLRRLLTRFRGTALTLRTAPGRPFRDPAIEAHAEALANEVDVAAAWIETILARPLFRQVQPEPISETALQSLEDEPLNGALHRVARRLLDPGLAYSPGGDLQSALKHTYDLFELFVLYRLIDELPKQLGSGWTLKGGKSLKYLGREERPADRAGWWFQGPSGLALELRYQQWFSRAQLPPDNRTFTRPAFSKFESYQAALSSL